VRDEEIVITASVSGFTPGETIYVKGAFYKDRSTNYFGYTKNGDLWIKNSAKTIGQRQVVIGAWDGTITVKSDYSDSGFSGNGNYLLKMGFYTLAKDGDPGSVDWSDNSIIVSLTQPQPTMTPTVIPKPTVTSKPTDTPTPTAPPISDSPTIQYSAGDVLGETEGDLLPEAASTESANGAGVTITSTSSGENVIPTVEPIATKQTNVLPYIYTALVTGILSLLSLGYSVWRSHRML